MEIVHKVTSAPVAAGFEYVLSDATVDSYGDVVEASGWDLSRFDTNPIALFNHDSNFPIGRWSNVRVEGGKLKGRLNFAAAGTSARVDEIRSLAEQGILRATSVGFAPLAAAPLKTGGKRYTKQLLHEVSLVSIPANPNAVQLAKSMHVSSDTISLVFGEHANSGDGIKRRGTHGEHAASPNPIRKTPMSTLSRRIEDAQNDFVAARDNLVTLNAADALDLEAIEAENERIEVLERTIAALKASEAKLAGSTALAAPAIVNRRPLDAPRKELSGLDLLVRAVTAHGVARFNPAFHGNVDKALDVLYPGHEATSVVTKADATIGTTTVSGWASELVDNVMGDFVGALVNESIYPGMAAGAAATYTFDGYGAVTLPRRNAGGANGSFVGEGSPIPVRRITTAAAELSPKKLGVIVPFSRELARRSRPQMESVVREAILEDTGATLDTVLLDSTAGSAIRPAGLLNGVTAIPAAAGGDYQAILEDINAVMAPFDAANAGRRVALIMTPAMRRKIRMTPGPDGTGFAWSQQFLSDFTILVSNNATANRLIAVDMADFVTGTGMGPEFEVNETATVHMEDTTPLEIVSGTGPTVADPVRSFFQTATIGVRMLWDVSWVMRRPGMVQWISGTSW